MIFETIRFTNNATGYKVFRPGAKSAPVLLGFVRDKDGRSWEVLNNEKRVVAIVRSLDEANEYFKRWAKDE